MKREYKKASDLQIGDQVQEEVSREWVTIKRIEKGIYTHSKLLLFSNGKDSCVGNADEILTILKPKPHEKTNRIQFGKLKHRLTGIGASDFGNAKAATSTGRTHKYKYIVRVSARRNSLAGTCPSDCNPCA